MSDAPPSDVAAALAAAGVGPVSRETIERLVVFVRLLGEWNQTHNLVGPSASDDIWVRHVADSAQLVALAPTAKRWLDLGSGAGFPGIVVAILLAGADEAVVHLVDSRGRKCSFLREAARLTGAPVEVHQARIEEILPNWTTPIDAVSARGLASLSQLGTWIRQISVGNVPAYFHKGLNFDEELAAMPDRTDFDLVRHQSRIGSGVIVELRQANDVTPRRRS